MTTLFGHRGRAARAFALCLLALAATLAQSREARAQWTQPNTQGHIANTNTGNVGIGTSAPPQRLTVDNPTDNGAAANIRLRSLTTRYRSDLIMQAGNLGLTINSYDDTTGAHMPVKLDASKTVLGMFGNVGVGTAAPGHTLSVLTAAGTRSGLSITGDGNPWVYTDLNMAPATTSTIAAGKPVNFAWSVRKDAYYGGDASGPSMVMEIWRQGGGAYVPFIINPSGNLILAGATNATNGNVGVGTLSPTSPLTVSSDTNVSPLLVSGNNPNVVGVVVNNAQAGSKAWALQVAGAGNLGGVPNGSLILRQASDNINPVVISKTGDMGVGTSAPATKLHVAGDIRVDGNINAKYQDLAEWVPSTEKLAAGTVVVLDTARDNHVLSSRSSYDTRVAGVVSAQPGIALGEAGDGKVLVATTGRVKVKVDATQGPINVGDLLVTSDREGYAMKSEPVLVGKRPMHSPGTLIGKALESLAGGTGEILVLLSLQ